MATGCKPGQRLALGALLLLTLLCGASGCSGVASQAVSVGRLPRWMFPEARANREPINFIRLRQDPPPVYQLGPRDVLGMYIEGVLGTSEEAPPVHFPEEGDEPPAIGFPIPIREDGTVALPLISPIKVMGLTLAQAEQAIRDRYIAEGILIQGRDRIIVTLLRKRTYEIMVIREDQGTTNYTTAQGMLLAGPAKRGAAFSVDLEAYENDVLHALTETGGLPGLDAQNEVIILRGSFLDAQGRNSLLSELQRQPYNGSQGVINDENPNIVRIPLRQNPGEPPQELREEDIILTTGDIVFIETREREVYYTGGLLQGGEHILPRDYDLDVVQALSVAGGQIAASSGSAQRSPFSGGGGGSFGAIPATQIIVVRQVPNAGSLAIRINLNRALLDPSQRIYVQPGDLVILEYTPLELAANIALGNISFQYFLNELGN